VSSLLKPEDRVLSTLNADGSRRWLDPKHVTGFFRSRRKLVGWILIAIFVTLPHLRANGRQLFQLDIAGGEFTFFGITLLRTDTLMFAIAMISVFIVVFLMTAVLGRVWCGWACPQTVYLEFVFRPIAKLFDGSAKKGLGAKLGSLPKPIRFVARWSIVTVLCFGLANTFLAYFIGTTTLGTWITQPPWVHPGGFGFVMFVTALMVGNFGFFREQLCFIACPYGRFQSVLLDRNSLVVGYDVKRGEPRGKLRRAPKRTGSGDLHLRIVEDAEPKQTEPAQGDCVACTQCVQVCPTGIDIREGLQMECIHCARCIDACDAVMTKIGKPKGLIRYSSQAALEGKPARMLRPRIVVYPVMLGIMLTTLAVMGVTKADADVAFIRARGMPFSVLPSGDIGNQLRMRITNRADTPRTFTITPDAEGVSLPTGDNTVTVDPGETKSLNVMVVAEPGAIVDAGGTLITPFTITDGVDFEKTLQWKVLGPRTAPKAKP
jgi:cytochrome c oxidase accessory protein FixG